MSECPFCGSDAVSPGYSICLEIDEVNGRFGECSNCGAMGPIAKTEEAAIELWNERR